MIQYAWAMHKIIDRVHFDHGGNTSIPVMPLILSDSRRILIRIL